MKMINKTLIAVAVSAGMVGGASAATVSSPINPLVPPATYAKKVVNETVRTTIALAPTVVTLGAGEALNVDDSITFTLSAGTWKAIASGDLTDTAATTSAYALVSGGVGENFATYRVTTAATAVADVVTLAATATVNGAAIVDGSSINVQVDMSGFVGGTPLALFSSPLTSLNAQLEPMMTGAVATSIAGTFSVATGYTTLLVTGASSVAGSITTTTSAGAAIGLTDGTIPLAIPTPANTILSISGPMADLVSITDAGAVTSSTATGGAPTGGNVANTWWIDTANNMAHAITTAAGPYTPILNFNTIAHAVSAYTLDITRSVDGSYAATTVLSGAALAGFGRDGSSFSSNSIGGLNKVTVTDRSGGIGAAGADGVITITAYDAAGATVACTGLTIAALPNNGTTSIQGADISSACTGAKRIEGTVNSSSIIVTNVKITADGATTTPVVVGSGATGGI